MAEHRERDPEEGLVEIGSVFSGIGGLELGLERAGVGHTVWQVESDPFRRRILARHWPTVERWTDATACVGQLPPVDLLCGGFPCTDLSSARHDAGNIDGPQSGLWRCFRDHLAALRPRWAVVENVADRWRRWVPVLRGAFHELGYASVPVQVCAADVGAPHDRARIFVVAYPHGEAQPARALDVEVGRLQAAAVAGRQDWRQPPPGALGVPDGVPAWVDRLRACGNAVVPQCAEVIGAMILGAEQEAA